MMEKEQIVIGQGSGIGTLYARDVYVHFADVQDQVCISWRFGKITGWRGVARALSEIEDLLTLSLRDADHPLLRDLRFLASLALMRATLDTEAAKPAAA